MDLWIRSQDKENLLKTTDIYLHDNISYKTEKQRFMRTDNAGNHYETWEDVDVIDKFICCEVWGDRTLLGKYKTKERALEVLDEIVDLMLPAKESFDENGEYNCKGCFANKDMMFYQMPEE